MAESHDQASKTEQPTEKRLSEASDEGRFARSHELGVLFSLGAFLVVLILTGGGAARDLATYFIRIFTTYPRTTLTASSATTLFDGVLATLGGVLAPLLVAIVIATLLACAVQSGFRLSPRAAAIRFENLDPIAGFGRVFSRHALIRGAIDVLKLAAIGSALWLGARGLIADPIFNAPIQAEYLGEFLSHATVLFLTRLLATLAVVAAISYGYEKFKMSRDLMMTRDEVKEERRQSDGDAHVKAALRRMARRLLQKQMMAAVPTADVIVTNPTHYAVALKYERGKDKAPVVLAKGENRFAQRIKAAAAAHGVPLVENKPVARMLFAMGRVGETIPPELYQAVAEILAVVYRTHRYYFHALKTRRMEARA